MSDRDASIGPPFWPGLAPNGLWSGFASNGFSDGQLKSLRVEQDRILNEVQKLFDTWCVRQHEMVQSTWSFVEELQHNGGSPGAVTAWMRWYGSTALRVAEDVRDQLAFGCMAAERCTAVFTHGLNACSAGALRFSLDDRGEHGHVMRDQRA